MGSNPAPSKAYNANNSHDQIVFLGSFPPLEGNTGITVEGTYRRMGLAYPLYFGLWTGF